MTPRSFSRRFALFFRALPALLVALQLLAPARADSPFLNRNGQPNALFWTAGAATIALDQPLYDLAQGLDSPATQRASRAFNTLGDGRTQIGALALLLIAGGSTEKRIARHGLHGLVAGGLTVLALKEATRKSRPWAERGPVYGVGRGGEAEHPKWRDPELGGHPDSNKSFPSGHTASAFALATVWAHERPREREIAYTLAVLAGLSRITLKQHWPSDVFWGAAIGAAAGSAAVRDVPFGLMFRIR